MAGTDAFDEVSIGDFDKPLAPPPKAKNTTAATGSAAERIDAAEDELSKAAKEAEQNLAPLERYEKSLKRLELTRDEAAAIVDAILMQGYWSKEMALTPRRKVKFRSRLYADTQRFHDYVEAVQPRNPSYYNEILYKYSLAASLVQYDKTVFAFPDKDDDENAVEVAFKKRLRFVESLSDGAVRLLYARLSQFDEILRVVMEEGAAENF